MVELPFVPARVAMLPKDSRGYPVPWFVAWIDDVPDFRVIAAGKVADAFNKNLCWICGQPKGIYHSFVIGPMCAVTRTNSEPPSHLDCAKFAAKACPFLTKPRMKRNEKDLPEDHIKAAGNPISRNPGCACVWVTKTYSPFQVSNGVLFKMGDPEAAYWYAEGRTATREEVQASITSGLPLLYEDAKKEGPSAVRELERCIKRLEPYLPQ